MKKFGDADVFDAFLEVRGLFGVAGISLEGLKQLKESGLIEDLMQVPIQKIDRAWFRRVIGYRPYAVCYTGTITADHGHPIDVDLLRIESWDEFTTKVLAEDGYESITSEELLTFAYHPTVFVADDVTHISSFSGINGISSRIWRFGSGQSWMISAPHPLGGTHDSILAKKPKCRMLFTDSRHCQWLKTLD
jgi:hypothetical protein